MNDIAPLHKCGRKQLLDLDEYIDDIISIALETRSYYDSSSNSEMFDESSDNTSSIYQQSLNSSNVAICIGFSKYEAVYRVIRKMRYKEVDEKANWDIYWTDGFISLNRMFHLKEYQKINHFPGMIEICRKDSLARNVNRLLKLFPNDYDIIPRTWCLPSDIVDFKSYCRKNRWDNFILKPEASCQGKGIIITKNVKDLSTTEGMVCQVYISHPFLMDEFKFDLRVYVLVTSIEPLRIYAYNEGLVRFTTVKYEEPNQRNINNVFMHLTNYTVQKESTDFIKDNEYMGTKRRFSVLNEWFLKHGYNIGKIWQDIDDVIIKTLISIQCSLRHNYRNSFPNHTAVSACYELLGFDIILDDQLTPLLIEVNHSPSFHTDSKIDRDIKDSLLFDTFRLLNIYTIKESLFYKDHSECVNWRLYGKKVKSFTRKEDKSCVENLKQKIFELEMTDMGNFRLLYPATNSGNYDKFIRNSISLFNETFSYRARLQLAHNIKDKLRKNQHNMDVIKQKAPTNTEAIILAPSKLSNDLNLIKIKIIERKAFKVLKNLCILEIINNKMERFIESQREQNKCKSEAMMQEILSSLLEYCDDCGKSIYVGSTIEKAAQLGDNTTRDDKDCTIINYVVAVTHLVSDPSQNNHIISSYAQVNWNI